MIVDLTPAREHGLCDRLRIVTYFIAVARLSGDDRIELCEPLSDYCPYPMCDSLRIDGLDLRPWEGPPPDTSRTLPVSASPSLTNANRYLPVGLAVTAEAFYECWLESYTLLRPKEPVPALVDEFKLSRRTLGIHVRRTDKVRKRPGRYELTAFESVRAERAMERLIRPMATSGTIDNVFIASDSAAGKADWADLVRSMGLPVVQHDAVFNSDLVRHTDAVDFFVDLFALSRCGIIVGNVISGVGYSARQIGGVAEFYSLSDPDRAWYTHSVQLIERRLRKLVFRE